MLVRSQVWIRCQDSCRIIYLSTFNKLIKTHFKCLSSRIGCEIKSKTDKSRSCSARIFSMWNKWKGIKKKTILFAGVSPLLYEHTALIKYKRDKKVKKPKTSETTKAIHKGNRIFKG